MHACTLSLASTHQHPAVCGDGDGDGDVRARGRVSCGRSGAGEPCVDEYPTVYLGLRVPLGFSGRPGRGGKGQSMRAHRLVCMLAHGLPDCWGSSGHVDCVHLCDNKGCVNPLHLAWAARAVNVSANANNEYDRVWRDRGGDAYHVGCGSVAQFTARWRKRLGDDARMDGAGDGSHSDDGGGDDGVAAVAAAVRVAVADVDMLTMQG